MKRVTVFALALGLILGVLAHPAIAGTTYYGAATDPVGDGDHGFGLEAELVFASVLADGTNLQLTARFATFDDDDMAIFVLDTDQNPATGSPGVDAVDSDADRIGAEYNLYLWPDQPTNNEVRLRQLDFDGVVTEVGVYPAVYLPDGIQASIPLSDLGGEDGLLSFKVIGSKAGVFLEGTWGCLDYLTDVGQPEVRTTPAIPAPSAMLLVAIGCMTGLAQRTLKRMRGVGA